MIVKDNEEFLISNNRLTGDALSVSSFIVGSIVQNQRFKYGDGMTRRVDYGFDDEYRKIKLVIDCKASYGYDIAALRDAINELFYGTFYVKEMRLTYNSDRPVAYEAIGKTSGELNLGEPNFVSGKQLKVRNVGEIVQSDDDLNFEIELGLETVETPYLETAYTTQELNALRNSPDAAKFGLVDGINMDYLDYTFTTNDFFVWNAGNLVVDPRYMELKIIVDGVTSLGNLTIESFTTGDKFIYKQPLNNQTLTLDGTKVLVGTTNYLRNSNRAFIKLNPQRNQFRISNASFVRVKFEFKFYYK